MLEKVNDNVTSKSKYITLPHKGTQKIKWSIYFGKPDSTAWPRDCSIKKHKQ